ncbi:MAG: tetratricopeptide repeat protein, partial [Cyanobacteria bacterium]|nr:tetratricopeptide repeat protein [Cyanobacteriota bacterium]
HQALGNIMRRKHEFDKAEQQYNLGRELAEKVYGKDSFSSMVLLSTLGNVAAERKDWKKMDEYYQSALAVLKKNSETGPFKKGGKVVVKSYVELLKLSGQTARATDVAGQWN